MNTYEAISDQKYRFCDDESHILIRPHFYDINYYFLFYLELMKIK